MPRKETNRDKPASADSSKDKLHDVMSDIVDRVFGGASRPPKPTKTVDTTYSLKLTEKQRENLINGTRIKSKLKERFQEAGEGAQIFELTRKELEHLDKEIAMSTLSVTGSQKRSLEAVLQRVVDLLSDRSTRKRPKSATKPGDTIYQFKITLRHITPVIWRRIQISDCTLADLHEYIQATFGWWNYHLHEFKIDGVSYMPPMPDGDDFGLQAEDESDIFISSLIPNSGRKPRWDYIYDFGDGWEHQIQFERLLSAAPKTKYPLCAEGARACPPEDCGGPWGYAEYLDAISNPTHENHSDLMDWRGPFDAEAFDINKATKEMRKVR